MDKHRKLIDDAHYSGDYCFWLAVASLGSALHMFRTFRMRAAIEIALILWCLLTWSGSSAWIFTMILLRVLSWQDRRPPLQVKDLQLHFHTRNIDCCRHWHVDPHMHKGYISIVVSEFMTLGVCIVCLLLLQSAGVEPKIRSTHLLFNKGALRARQIISCGGYFKGGSDTNTERENKVR